MRKYCYKKQNLLCDIIQSLSGGAQMTEFRLPHADPSPSKSPKGLQSSISFAAADIYYLYKGLSFRQRAAHITVPLYRWKGQRG